MKRPLLPAFLILLLLGLMIWRESTAGFLREVEHAVAQWAYLAMGGKGGPDQRVVLVLQGGIRGEELSSLDVGLFTRAAARLEVAVAGIASWEVAQAQIRLVPPKSAESTVDGSLRATRFLAGAILLPGSAAQGQLPAVLPVAADGGLVLSEFSGSYSMFPAEVGWETGFLNLPEPEMSAGENAEAGYLAVAERAGEVLPSFALAALLASQPDRLLVWQSGKTFTWDGYELPVAKSGVMPLRADGLRQLHRVDMDDLLLEAERREKGLPGNEELQVLLEGSIALLGTLAQDEEILTAPGSQRRLSLVEFQGLAVQSLLAGLQPPTAPWWAGGVALILILPLTVGLWLVTPGTSNLLALLFFSASLLLGGALSVQIGLLLPALLPSLLWPAAGLLRLFLRRPRMASVS
jgi:hypothetical protein